MRELIAVKGISLFADYRCSALKRDALIYNRLAALNFDESLESWEHSSNEQSKYILDNARWLLEKGFIFQPELPFPTETLVADQDYETGRAILANAQKEMLETYAKYNLDSPEQIKNFSRIVSSPNIGSITKAIFQAQQIEVFAALYSFEVCLVRLSAIALRKEMEAYSIPILYRDIKPNLEARDNFTLGEVIQIAIKSLPIPDDSVSWEQIFDYRSDPDSFNKFLALRDWMGEVAREKLTPVEVEEKLEYLVNQYQQHIKLHKMKASMGTLESVLTVGAGFLENVAKLKLEKAVKGLFHFKHKKIELMEAELKSPGYEVAYIAHTQEKFSR
ncbi:MAG TPA: hypothetical protein VJ464_13460 [Blastocatellia bacterium]|nr:hypothetical protein [Blastocatellia bacterium]